MECSASRQSSSSRFPFFFSSLWSSPSPSPSPSTPPARTQQTASTQTTTKSPLLPAVNARRAPEREAEDREMVGQRATGEMSALVGLENVKRQLQGVQSWVQICRRHGRDPRNEGYSIALQGNPGTGKTTIAGIYARMLFSIDISDTETIRQTSGNELIALGVRGTQQLLQSVVDVAPAARTAGALIIDHPRGLSKRLKTHRQIVDAIADAMERPTGRIVVIFTGDSDDLDTFFKEHARIHRRICSTITFDDFDRPDLQALLSRRISEEYHDRMQLEGGVDGPYLQAAARRLARGRGRKGFTNVYAVRELVKTIAHRQVQCLMEQRDNGVDEVDYFFFSREDLLGPSPGDVKERSESWAQLHALVGQDAVKTSIREVVDTADENYWRETRNQRRLPMRLHRIFAGPVGTGKKTAATLYAHILYEMGLLSSDEVNIHHLSSLPRPAPHAGLAPEGQALILDISGDGTPDSAVIDILAAEMSSSYENRCIILLGDSAAIAALPDSIKQATRFEQHLIPFQSFTQEELEQLLQNKLQDQGVDTTPDAFQAAIDILISARMRRDFDNARAVDRLLLVAHHHYEARRAQAPPAGATLDRVLEAEDFDAGSIGGGAALSFREELRHTIVPDEITSVLKRYHREMKTAWLQGQDPGKRVPCTLVFKGGSGSGKKTVASQLGTLYYKMGVLDSDELIDCSVADLISSQAGHSSLRTRSQLEASRGKVLFVDDAHRLTENDSALQAMDELIYLLPRYAGHTVVILAGPPSEMDHLLANRPRLSGLFQEEIIFRCPTPRECLRLLDRYLDEHIPTPRPYLIDTQVQSHREFTRAVQVLSMFPCWSNARDIKLLARWMVSAAVRDIPLDGTPLPPVQLSEDQAMTCMIKLFNLKRDRLRYNQDPKARMLPRILSQPRCTERTGVRFPV
ncbi:protein GbpA [Aspergillus candidus]|uniref:AAA+ ATPase domain-containing protein n=1 Tax=Aspergillus candidus TaxID=41067 RepID=A0A2I2FA36_ASPCN|nr:hypothetical protein BDW47DRAFT_126197 [Aspergillus candidus]PLB37494.1 hypothetical protein BDW47DRAFT_126197 [Aspergillus candidus]